MTADRRDLLIGFLIGAGIAAISLFALAYYGGI